MKGSEWAGLLGPTGKVSLIPGALSLVYTQPREEEGWLLAGTNVLGE